MSGCAQTTSGGRGNKGHFVDRNPNICSAGVVSGQTEQSVKDCMTQYKLQDEVDALISDSIFPDPEPKALLPLRKPIPLDMRFAGPYGDVAQLINPGNKTKFQGLVEDFKSTIYSSYWKKPLGLTSDPTPMLPDGFDLTGTTFGRKVPYEGRLYDLIMPKIPHPDKTPRSKEPAVQVDRNYCAPPFNTDLTYGIQCNIDPQGHLAKCCLTDDRIKLGTHKYMPLNTLQTEFRERTFPKIAQAVTPNENINMVPPGHAFGKLYSSENFAQCLMDYPLNPAVLIFKQCVGHLNSLRKKMSKRFQHKYFEKLYLNLKYEDKEKRGWLPNTKVYEICAKHHIQFDSTLIEPLLCTWNAFDGTNIEYKMFVHILNYREPIPPLPKIPYMENNLPLSSTYTEMTRPGQELGPHLRAGLPSGRYFDMDYPVTPINCTKADINSLPHETGAGCMVSPSILTLLGVSHRHMYAKRSPEQLRKIFANAGDNFTDEQFNALWEKAQELHSLGWVCIETFRQTMAKYPDILQNKTDENDEHMNSGDGPQNSGTKALKSS